jgi:hypothetical protein
MPSLTRREFLDLAARQSAGASLAASFLLASCRSGDAGPSALGLDRPSTQDLIALLDEIIPASDGMAAASEAGTLPYFELLAASEPKLARTVSESLSTVGALAADRHGKRFAALPRDRRRETVAAFAQASPDLFGALRTYVYEGYYLQPRVWGLLGYEPYPTNGPGPSMASFDPATLDRVRSMRRLWREV